VTFVALGDVGSAVYQPGSAVGPRDMSQFQLVWILRGSADWSTSGVTRTLRPGQLVLVQPGTRDHWQWDRSDPTTHGYVYFTLPGSWRPTPGDWPVQRLIGEDDPIPSALRYLLRLDPTSEHDRAIAAELIRFVLVVFTHASVLGDRDGLPPALEAAVDHVYRAWTPSGIARPVGLAELARAASLSSGQLSRIFRKRFGVAPVTAFELLRLSRAATLLSQSDLPVTAIARSCGFADAGHFSHRFRRTYGSPPGRYRQSETSPDPAAPLATARLLPLAARLLR
jgi:AraC-like DNA-binding protein